ncbi:BRO-N domain-containing protein [Paenibacillus algicola]|uniref:BRO-N domain-containing protein n=1 Tax=Paenibacillus algicola TaxID=2565926 RepID=UPI00389907E3
MRRKSAVFTYGTAQVRTVTIAGEPWFVARDVCAALSMTNASQSISRLDADEKNTIILNEGNRGNPNYVAVNEPGLYSLILGSRKPEARAFKRWITHEVIPSIRRNLTIRP